MNTSLRQVLVHLDAGSGAMHRLRAARQVALAHGAAVRALYATPSTLLAMPYAGDMTASASAAAELVEMDNQQRMRVNAAFEQACAEPGPPATWAEINDGFSVVSAFVEQAFYADLLVLGQHQADDPLAALLPTDFAESVVMASGKPALVLPYIGWKGPVGETVAVAWKPTREAARAVSAALPLMRRARRVHILSWGPAGGAPDGGLDLDGYLRLHGIDATWHRGGEEPAAIGELVLSRAFDLGADLLVAGCYGHSRARELVLGGATRTLLRSMTLPVLTAH